MITIEYEHLVAFSVALIIAFFSTPIARRIARAGAVTPRAAGVCIKAHALWRPPLLALALLCLWFASRIYPILFFYPAQIPGRFRCSHHCGSGIVDDIRPLKAGIKFVFQLLAAIVVVGTGTRITSITLPFTMGTDNGMTYILGETIAFVISVLWIAGVTNAINLIDGLDGLAAGVSGIASVSLFIVAVIRREDDIALAAVSLAGAIFGFLPIISIPPRFLWAYGCTFLGFILATPVHQAP